MYVGQFKSSDFNSLIPSLAGNGYGVSVESDLDGTSIKYTGIWTDEYNHIE